MADFKRGEMGPLHARPYLAQHAGAFEAATAELALASRSQGDECFALVSAGSGFELGPALESFVAACSRKAVPDTSVGVSFGPVDLDLDLPWNGDADDHTVVCARALARIAANNQVLVDGSAYTALTVADGFIPSLPDKPRRLFGVQDTVVVFVAPWGDKEQTKIWNLPLLRPQLKQLENRTAEELMRSDDVDDALSAFDSARSDSKLLSVRSHFQTVAWRIDELQAYFDTADELCRLPTFIAGFTALQGAAARLVPACDAAKAQIGTEEAKTTLFDITTPWQDVRGVLRRIHLDADKLIMAVDDGLAIGQPAGWRY